MGTAARVAIAPSGRCCLRRPAQAGTYHVYFCAARRQVCRERRLDGRADGRRDRGRELRAAQHVDRADACRQRDAGWPTARSPRSTFTQPGRARRSPTSAERASSTSPTGVADGTHPYLRALRARRHGLFDGAGDYHDATRNALNAQKQLVRLPRARSTAANTRAPASPRWPATTGDATQLDAARRLLQRAARRARRPTGGDISNIAATARRRPSTTRRRRRSRVEASGLLAGGTRSGSDPVTVTATDNSGIQQRRDWSTSRPGRRRSSAREDYDGRPHRRANRLLRLPASPRRARTSAARRSRRRRCQPAAAQAARARDRHRRQRRPTAARITVDRVSRRPTAARSTARTRPRPGAIAVAFAGSTHAARAPSRYKRRVTVRGRAVQPARHADRRRDRARAAHGRPAPQRRAGRTRRDGHDARRRALHLRRTRATASRAAPVRLALARQRHPLRRQRLPDAAAARDGDASASARARRRRPAVRVSGRLRGYGRPARPRQSSRAAAGARARPLDVRGHDAPAHRALSRSATASAPGLARRVVRVPRPHPRRRRTSRTRPGVLQRARRALN